MRGAGVNAKLGSKVRLSCENCRLAIKNMLFIFCILRTLVISIKYILFFRSTTFALIIITKRMLIGYGINLLLIFNRFDRVISICELVGVIRAVIVVFCGIEVYELTAGNCDTAEVAAFLILVNVDEVVLALVELGSLVVTALDSYITTASCINCRATAGYKHTIFDGYDCTVDYGYYLNVLALTGRKHLSVAGDSNVCTVLNQENFNYLRIISCCFNSLTVKIKDNVFIVDNNAFGDKDIVENGNNGFAVCRIYCRLESIILYFADRCSGFNGFVTELIGHTLGKIRHRKCSTCLCSTVVNTDDYKSACKYGDIYLVYVRIFIREHTAHIYTVDDGRPYVGIVCEPILKLKILPSLIIFDIECLGIFRRNHNTLVFICTVNTLTAAVELVEGDISVVGPSSLKCFLVHFGNLYTVIGGNTVSYVRECGVIFTCLGSYPRISLTCSAILICELIILIVYPITVVNVNVLASEEVSCRIGRLLRAVLSCVTDEHSATAVCIPLICRGNVREYVELGCNRNVLHQNLCTSVLTADYAAVTGVKITPHRGKSDGRVNNYVFERVAVLALGYVVTFDNVNIADDTTVTHLIVTDFNLGNNDIFKGTFTLCATNYRTDRRSFYDHFSAVDCKVLDSCVVNRGEQACALAG